MTQIETDIAEIKRDIAVIAQKLNGGPGQSYLCKQHAEEVHGLAGRVSALEQGKWKFVGGLAAAVFFIQIVVSVVLKVVKL